MLGGAGLLFSLMLPIRSADIRICAAILCAGPSFALGILGIRGDPVSAALLHVFHYFRTRRIMLFDSSVRALQAAPVERMMEDRSAADRIRLYADRKRNERLERRIRQACRLGGNGSFAADTDYARDYIDTSDFGRPLEDADYEFVEDECADEVLVGEESDSETFPYIPCIPAARTAVSAETLPGGGHA